MHVQIEPVLTYPASGVGQGSQVTVFGVFLTSMRVLEYLILIA
jgi:hypothetical protein